MGGAPVAIRGLCPLLQAFDMPTSLRFYATCWVSSR